MDSSVVACANISTAFYENRLSIFCVNMLTNKLTYAVENTTTLAELTSVGVKHPFFAAVIGLFIFIIIINNNNR